MKRDILILAMIASVTMYLIAAAIQANDYTAARNDNLMQVDADDGRAQTGLLWTSTSFAGIVLVTLAYQLFFKKQAGLKGGAFFDN